MLWLVFDSLAEQEDCSGNGCRVSSWLISFPCAHREQKAWPFSWCGAEGAEVSKPVLLKGWLTVWGSLLQPQSLLTWSSCSTLLKCPPLWHPSVSSKRPVAILNSHVISPLLEGETRWDLSMRHLNLAWRQNQLQNHGHRCLVRPWWEVPGKEGSSGKSHHWRAVFELSISYSFVYFTCSLTV